MERYFAKLDDIPIDFVAVLQFRSMNADVEQELQKEPFSPAPSSESLESAYWKHTDVQHASHRCDMSTGSSREHT